MGEPQELTRQGFSGDVFDARQGTPCPAEGVEHRRMPWQRGTSNDCTVSGKLNTWLWGHWQLEFFKLLILFFLPFIKRVMYSIPFVSSAESVLHHGPCREDIPLSPEGDLIKVLLFFMFFIISIFRFPNLDSVPIQLVQHCVWSRDMGCLANSDEFHIVPLPFWHQQLLVWLPRGRYLVLYLSSVISSQVCRGEKRYNFSGMMHWKWTGNPWLLFSVEIGWFRKS